MKKVLKKVFTITALLFAPSILFFVEGLIIGCFYSAVPRSNFYSYYWVMFPATLAPGIVSCFLYLMFTWGCKND